MPGPAVKRGAASSSDQRGPNKRGCRSETASAITSSASPDHLSLRDRAEPYRLVTAIFPIDALTPVWKRGTNRSLNVPHQRRLCHAFRRELRRTDLDNALRLTCTQQEVDRMIAELERQGQGRTDWKHRTPGSWPSFMDWMRVNAPRVELMAGHHRVEALKEYLKDQGGAAGERWWLCDVYDQGEWGPPGPGCPLVGRDSRG